MSGNLPQKYRPLVPSCIYPAFRNGRLFEEYFFEFWQSIENNKLKDKFYYIDIFWHNIKCGSPKVPVLKIAKEEQEKVVHDYCRIATSEGKIPFTICQWGDNIEIKKPQNLIVFTMGSFMDFPLPLIVEDKSNRLLKTERISFKDKKYLASFVGTTMTHSCRTKIVNFFQKNNKFMFKVKNRWSVNISTTESNNFIEITKDSKFGLAPRGYGPTSFRFFEIMQLGVIPVYIHTDNSDRCLPFLDEPDTFDYSSFSIEIHIKDINKLETILESIDEKQYNEMLNNLNKVMHHFSMQGTSNYILRNLERNRQ